jgi:hypothetical protein
MELRNLAYDVKSYMGWIICAFKVIGSRSNPKALGKNILPVPNSGDLGVLQELQRVRKTLATMALFETLRIRVSLIVMAYPHVQVRPTALCIVYRVQGSSDQLYATECPSL